MYYITNQNNQVVAADKALLELVGLQSIEELYQKMIKGELSLSSLSPDNVTITSEDNDEQHTFDLKSSPLSSMLGELTLNVLISQELTEAPKTESVSPTEELSILEMEEEPVSIDEEETITFGEPEEEPITFGETEEEPMAIVESEETSTDEDMISILDEDFLKEPEEEITIGEEEPKVSEEPSDFEPISILEETEVSVSETVQEDEKSTEPINIDIDNVSKTIGITPDEYNNFLNEFIDNAISLEKDLNSEDAEVQSSAVKSLVQLSEVLLLPELTNAAKAINEASAQERDSLVESFYNKLARITTQSTTLPEVEKEEAPLLDIEEEILTAPEMEIAEEPETAEEEETLPEGSFGTIDLSEVKPIHFDFRLEEAADELSLPVELIEEFVHDFIEQARTETENMLEAYKQGDLDRIQKIGHLLKGASSNLRINPLADTLYEIQFCEESSRLEGLIKNYWAHFIAFEKQMELTSK